MKRVLLCTGKVYYDLALAREARKAHDVAIIRLEQLYPLNEELTHVLAPYKDGTPLVWVQEEPQQLRALVLHHGQRAGLHPPPAAAHLRGARGQRQPRHRLAREPPARAEDADRRGVLVSEGRKALQDQYAPRSICFGCGPANAKGLRIKSFVDGDTLVADFTPEPYHHAFPGMLNGGIIGALLDCHSNWAACHHLMTANAARRAAVHRHRRLPRQAAPAHADGPGAAPRAGLRSRRRTAPWSRPSSSPPAR